MVKARSAGIPRIDQCAEQPSILVRNSIVFHWYVFNQS